MTNSKKMELCQELFKTMEILRFYIYMCIYIYIYIFSFIVCGEQKTFIYKELRSP